MQIFRKYLLHPGVIWMLAVFGPAQGQVAEEAAELYHDYCSVCHGDAGDGDSRAKQGLITPPRDFTDPAFAPLLTRERMINAVLNGVPGTAMVPWDSRLSRQQVETIVDYILTNFVQGNGTTAPPAAMSDAGRDAPPGGMQAPMPGGLRGNSEVGKAFYLANCSTCHGIEGTGDGPRAYFINPPPRNFRSEESRRRFNRPTLFAAIKHGVRGKEMPAWKFVLSDQRIADITEYVFSEIIMQEQTAAGDG